MYIKRSKYLVQFSSVECKEWRADDISTSHGRSIKTLSTFWMKYLVAPTIVSASVRTDQNISLSTLWMRWWTLQLNPPRRRRHPGLSSRQTPSLSLHLLCPENLSATPPSSHTILTQTSVSVTVTGGFTNKKFLNRKLHLLNKFLESDLIWFLFPENIKYGLANWRGTWGGGERR